MIKFDNSNEGSLVFLHSQCFLVKRNDSITKLSRLINRLLIQSEVSTKKRGPVKHTFIPIC